MPKRQPLEIFISYSHHDDAWREQLFDDYISTTFGDCRIWSDAQIRVGEHWNDQIQQQLERSSVAVLLVSEGFLASPFVTTEELPHILARASEAALRIVWIPIGITREALAQRPELVRIQAAAGLDEALPASPVDCPPAMLEQVRLHIRQQLQSAVDPVGAELMQLVDRRYQVGHWIAEGNLAAVYKAHDRVLRREVAIKVLKDKSQRHAFMADVRDAIRMSEAPNFVNVYDAAAEEVAAYCVMQHVGGQTLRERLLEHPRGLPINTLCKVLSRVTAAVSRAHELGISHGNVKPSNIILDRDDEPFILPVGRRRDPVRQARAVQDLLARLADPAGASASDLEDLAYLVPDGFGAEFDPVDPALADQYMLGLLAYEMATGRRPQTIVDPARLASDGRAAFRVLPPITDTRPLCPQHIATMVSRMVSRQPSERFPDLQAVLAEARQFHDLSLIVARDSYRRCAGVPGFDKDFFCRFYADFLRRCPAAGSRFERFGHEDWARQHRMLKEAVLLLFAFRQPDEGGAEPNVLSRVAATHVGMPGAFFEHFVDALIGTVCGDEAANLTAYDPACSDPSQRDALEAHWRVALAPGLHYMRDVAGRPVSPGGAARPAPR
jgi:tRNA A-37 threonylcarbamoyl transferase component Bud32